MIPVSLKKIFHFLHKCIISVLLCLIYIFFFGATKLFLVLTNNKILRNSNRNNDSNWVDSKPFNVDLGDFDSQS